MKLRLFLLALLLVLGAGSYRLYNYLSDWKWAFKQSPSLVFYSLHTDIIDNSSIPNLTDWPLPTPIERNEGLVMEKTVISDPAAKEELIEATQRALIPEGEIISDACFIPREAVATPDGKVTILLCFECGHVRIITPRDDRMVPINRRTKILFGDWKRKHHLKSEEQSAPSW